MARVECGLACAGHPDKDSKLTVENQAISLIAFKAVVQPGFR